MFKIEKSKKSNEIQIGMRQSAFIFDRYFILALVTAIAIHLAAALLFHVRLFSMWEIETILPATKAYAHFVKSSVEENDTAAIAQINREGRLTPAQLAPNESLPVLPPLKISSDHQSIDYRVNNVNNPFVEIEKDIEEKYFEFDEIPLIIPSIKIIISGPLSEIPLQDFDAEIAKLFVLQKLSSKNLHQERLVYAVKVNMHTGQIFWFQPQESITNKKQTYLAEKILKNILFQTNDKDFLQNGQVEITFTSGAA